MKKGTLIGSILGGLFGTGAVIGGAMFLEKRQAKKMTEEDPADVEYVMVEDTDSDGPADNEADTAEE